jgi:ABC-type uncharacterized transport system permease subunit
LIGQFTGGAAVGAILGVINVGYTGMVVVLGEDVDYMDANDARLWVGLVAGAIVGAIVGLIGGSNEWTSEWTFAVTC